MRFSITWPSDGCDRHPAHAPAGHRPVFRERVDEDDAVVRRHHVVERGRARSAAIPEARIGLVGDDPEAVLAREREQEFQIVMRRGPAGRIGRRHDDHRARARRDRRRRAVRNRASSRHCRIVIGTMTGFAPITPVAAAAFGQAGVGIMTSVAGAACHRERGLDRLHARAGDVEFVRIECASVKARVIARERVAQFRQAALPGVECLARRECARGFLRNEIRRRQVAFAGPQPHDAAAAAAVIHGLDDAAFGRLARVGAQVGDQGRCGMSSLRGGGQAIISLCSRSRISSSSTSCRGGVLGAGFSSALLLERD